MRLEPAHKEVLLIWITEGLQFKEINDRAKAFDPTFDVSRGQIKYYRKKRKKAIEGIKETLENDLTAKQFLFCEYYIQTSNGTLSSKLAGYKGDNDNVHGVNAFGLLRNPKIRAYLKKRYADVVMDGDEVLARLAKLARASLSDYIGEYGVIDWDKVEREGYALSKVSHSLGKQSRIEIEGRLRALELIGRAHAMFTDKIAPVDPTGTKEYGADARNALLSKLIPGLALEDEEGETGEADG